MVTWRITRQWILVALVETLALLDRIGGCLPSARYLEWFEDRRIVLATFQLPLTVWLWIWYWASWPCFWTELGSTYHCAAKPVYWHQVAEKENRAFIAFIAGPSKENGLLMLKRPELFDGFGGRVLKTAFGVKVVGGMTFFWLVGGEITGWWSRNFVFSLKLRSYS